MSARKAPASSVPIIAARFPPSISCNNGERGHHIGKGIHAHIRLNAQLINLRSSEATRTKEASAMHSSQAWG